MQKRTHFNITEHKLGVLGGGQLGKMLGLAAGNWHLPFFTLDEGADFPAAPVATRHTEGSFRLFDDVYNFGKDMDVLTIEIEHVNTDALEELEQEGITRVHPHPRALSTIKDKGRQKEFYQDRKLPTSPFALYPSAEAIRQAIAEKRLEFPFVQKTRTAGYDGRGVAVIQRQADLDKLMEAPSLVEAKVDIDKELAVIAARNRRGEVLCFPTVEMEFDPEANLVEFLSCPAGISPEVDRAAQKLAERAIKEFDISGLLAVELFLTKTGEVIINEVAPRPHNSGHHTIDSCHTSQFEQHLRAILDLPLGNPGLHSPAVMVNLLGHPDHYGPAKYEGVRESLAIPGVHLHLYGKKTTKPFRKMGHATVTAEDLDRARERACRVKELLQVVSSGKE